MTGQVEFHRTRQGGRIYRLPLEVFPGFAGNAYLIIVDEFKLLFDVGSGLGQSNQHLEAGIQTVAREYDEDVDWQDLTHILISHGHIDHFGGLPFVQQRSPAPVGVHSLDLPVLTDYETRLELVEASLSRYLAAAGMSGDDQQELMELYLLNKSLFSSVPVDYTIQAGTRSLGRIKVAHTPGHCPGQIVLRLDDVLISSDHILPDVSPHQSPERLSLGAGLNHYLDSLEQVLGWPDEIRLTLPGHGQPITDLRGRIQAIAEVHRQRLGRILQQLNQPRSLAQLTAALFPNVNGYNRLLAVEEAGAHVEFLELHGLITRLNPNANNSDGHGRLYRALDDSPARLDKLFEPFQLTMAPAALEGRINV